MLLNHSVLSISAFSKLYILLFEPENIFESFKLTITDFLVDTYGDTIFGFMDADLTPILNDLNKKNVDTLLVHCYLIHRADSFMGFLSNQICTI